MYGILGGIYGALLSVMNTFNSQLTTVYGNAGATVLIHAVGLLVLLPFAFTSWGRMKQRSPWYMFSGGLIGILTVVFCNVSIAGIGVTANLVLMLLGQLAVSTVIDHFGLFGTEKVRINGERIVSLAVIAAGDLAMLLWPSESAGDGTTSVVLAVVLALLSGLTMVLARLANAALATRSGTGFSTVMNYVTGLAGSVVLLACMGFKLNTAFPAQDVSWTIYLGGALGAVGIFLCNVVTPKLPTLEFTIIIFVGQIFAGMLLDALLLGRFSVGTLVGGLVVAVGMVLNVRAGAKEKNPAEEK